MPSLTGRALETFKPLLPWWTPSLEGRRPRFDGRKALTGIFRVLNGHPWDVRGMRVLVRSQIWF
jgi:hypothetical protein